jgi:anthranilate phosphoribosyltransferase
MAAGAAADIRAGIDKARETVRSGAALAKLDQLIAFCRA